ncbi:hydrogenase maturation factor [Burkholderia sp. Nafp2/4-1b]|uniref:hydrogenase maturation factor n=1 Tax=Burkholderia sp. Nafp2/4-1b TaxID=2116686 RepID=UPI000EF94692|nr:hydrogenase maturation factor [Burkholderia sp. Nafp2/4-1b]RKU04434.1 hydrogenase maturation factor [Burkholderia sp. Nafp2/4-1b]
MNSVCTYRGYTIDVRCEFRLDPPRDPAPPPETLRFGFVAVVQVRAAGSAPRLLAPIRLADDGGRLFDDTRHALRAGLKAGEIIVDDLLIDAGPPDGRTHS